MFVGLSELTDQLKRMASEVQDEADHIVMNATQMTAQELRAEYRAVRTSRNDVTHLEDGVREVVEDVDGFTRGRVISASPHAHLYEYGTETRRYTGPWKTGKGTGKAPARFALTKIAIKRRSAMLDELKNLVRKNGGTIRG